MYDIPTFCLSSGYGMYDGSLHILYTVYQSRADQRIRVYRKGKMDKISHLVLRDVVTAHSLLYSLYIKPTTGFSGFSHMHNMAAQVQ